MHLTGIEADRLRNLRTVRLSLPDGLTLITGNNGQGKTSLLEAIYLLGTGRSFRTSRLDELICRDGGPARIRGSVDGKRGKQRLGVELDEDRRILLCDGAEQKHEDFIGRLPVVDLTGDRMLVLRGGPQERRRFIDRGLVGLRPSYLRALGEHRRVLRQRNALIKGMRGARDGARLAELGVWSERLVESAEEIHCRRREYVADLAMHLREITPALFPSGRKIELGYRPSPAAGGEEKTGNFKDIYAKTLEEDLSRDLAVGYTGRGPHRDELLLEMDGIDLRRFGSAGQIRASMVGLKLGKISLLRKSGGEAPLFLMDDFDSDLDEVRAAALAAFLKDGGFQSIVATSKDSMAERLGAPFMRVRMEDGEVRPV